MSPREYVAHIAQFDPHALAAEAREHPEMFDKMRHNLLAMADDVLAMTLAIKAALGTVEAAQQVLAGEGPRAN
jgi:hypothetical protein